MKKITALTIAIISLVYVSCGEGKKKAEPEVIKVETKEEKKEYAASKMEAEFNDPKIANIYKQYIKLKTALVNTNAEKAAAEASNLATLFAKVEMDEATLQEARTIAESKDVEEQRTAFFKITAKVEGLLEDALSSGTIYKQYCPMAFGNTGAYWLSNSKDIYNPYFGDKMLKCGRIDAEIK